MSGTVLKGGVSYNKYVWKSSEGACKTCQSLDGTEYEYEGDIPDKPHPNCQCYVEMEEVEGEEECDIADQVDEIFDELDEFVGDVNSTKDEAAYIYSFVENAINYPVHQFVINLGQSILDAFNEAMAAWEIFNSNKEEMEQFRGYDKYYHAKANCEATQLGEIGKISAYILSIGKEVKDLLYKVIVAHKDFEETWNDCMEDLRADEYGIYKGHQEGQCGESVKDVGDVLKGRVERIKGF